MCCAGYRSTHGRDGYVSLEVSPFLAKDTARTVAEARHCSRPWRDRTMIKIPATAEGLPAITASIAAGVSINVTLIFSLATTRRLPTPSSAVSNSWGQGPTAKGGHPVDRIASVASFFVSRVDSAVDKELEKQGASDLLGKIAIANCKLAYAEFRNILSRRRWQNLTTKGARPQRVLWGSTSTKNPSYPDTMYVDELIGPDTVNTLPPETLKAFIDHGCVAETITQDLEGARRQLSDSRSWTSTSMALPAGCRRRWLRLPTVPGAARQHRSQTQAHGLKNCSSGRDPALRGFELGCLSRLWRDCAFKTPRACADDLMLVFDTLQGFQRTAATSKGMQSDDTRMSSSRRRPFRRQFCRIGYGDRLGTGSTTQFALERLGELIGNGRLRDVVGIPSSLRTEKAARQLGIPSLISRRIR
jgi:transaldolase